jgi:hypothetical protein
MLRLSTFSGSSRTFCLITHCSQDLSTKSIPLSQNCNMASLYSPRSNLRRPFCVHGIALGQLLRHRMSNEREDLDKAIVNFTESILLSPISWLQHGPRILDALFQLAHVLFLRSNVSKQPEDAICATKCLSHLRDQPHEIQVSHAIKSQHIS